jgi:hypothetical protein
MARIDSSSSTSPQPKAPPPKVISPLVIPAIGQQPIPKALTFIPLLPNVRVIIVFITHSSLEIFMQVCAVSAHPNDT